MVSSLLKERFGLIVKNCDFPRMHILRKGKEIKYARFESYKTFSKRKASGF